MKFLTANITTLTLFLLISCGGNNDKTDNANIDTNPTSLKEQETDTKINVDNKDKIGMTYTNIPKEHINSDNGIRYEVNVGFNSERINTTKRKDFFYKSEGNKTIIYNSWLEYGFMNGIYPCSPDCNTKLFAHTQEGIQPLKDIKLVIDSQDVCGTIQPLISVNHKKIEPVPLFVTTMNVPSQNTFIEAKNLKIDTPPKWVNFDALPIPEGATNNPV